MEEQQVTHIHLNSRYRIVFERSAVKGIDGFKIEANSDDLTAVKGDTKLLYEYAKNETEMKDANTKDN